MDLIFRDNYWDNTALKNEFNRFLTRVFRFDLCRWDEHGYWDDKYRPFSFFEGDTIVSNLCLYSMDMSVMGKRCRVAQISAVGTLPEYRRQGLSSELTRIAMDWARPSHDFFYLFADQEAYSFYEHAGFRLVDEYSACAPIEGRPPASGVNRLNLSQPGHLDLIYRIASEREPVSDLLGVLNEKLFMFWCLYFLADNIYYIEASETLVLLKRDHDTLIIFDIVSRKMPAFSEIYPFISDRADRKVEFRFMIDKMDLANYEEVKLGKPNGTHLLGSFPLEGRKFIFPSTSQA